MTFTVLEGLIVFKNMQWDSPVLNDADKTGVITLSENNPQLLPWRHGIEKQVGHCAVDIP